MHVQKDTITRLKSSIISVQLKCSLLPRPLHSVKSFQLDIEYKFPVRSAYPKLFMVRCEHIGFFDCPVVRLMTRPSSEYPPNIRFQFQRIAVVAL